MKCPKCTELYFFRVEAWEVTTYTAYLNNVDIESTKQQDTLHVALESDSNVLCLECGHEAALSDFGPDFPFPILQRPDFDQGTGEDTNPSDLARVLRKLLACTDLNVENLDPSSVSAIESANHVLDAFNGVSKGGVT